MLHSGQAEAKFKEIHSQVLVFGLFDETFAAVAVFGLGIDRQSGQ